MTTTERRLVVVVAVLGLLLGGCGGGDGSTGGAPGGPAAPADPADPADPPGGAPAPPATFDADVVPGADGVRITYTLRNDGTGELLVVDGVPRPSGATVRYAPDRAYVTGRGADGILLSQRVFPWPDTDGMAWDQAPRVGVTRLAAGQELRRELTVPEPFVRAHPFGDDLGDGPVALPAHPSEVTFCLGVIAPPYPPALALDEGEGEDDVPTVNHGNVPWAAQHQLCSDPVPLD
ncbi:hypothetical protein [Pimelobacter simplex]|uniref:hypothetical protein n=1 Tax=Nocardioides simplex TaxID=2045 RepID=UPI003AB07903